MRLSISVCSKVVLLSAAAALIASGAQASWGPDGTTIKATSSIISKVAATNDGGMGTFVIWQEESAPGVGVLRALHVLPSGDVDPAWPSDGFVLCSAATDRSALGAIPDRLGGAYVWWKEGASIYLSRVDGNAAVASGWPARGRMLGTALPATALPDVIEDGAHGVYAAWSVGALFDTEPTAAVGVHLGPANTGVGGWPNGSRGIASGGTANYWPRIARADDGGLFVAWASCSADPEVATSAYRLRRLTTAGLSAPGWDAAGIELAEFHREYLGGTIESGLVGLAEDGTGGVFAMLGLVSSDGYGTANVDSRVFHRQGDGSPAAGWPAGGASQANSGIGAYFDLGPEASFDARADGTGGVNVGLPANYDHGSSYVFGTAMPSGGYVSGTGGGIPGHEVVDNRFGGVFYAHFYPKGPYGPYEPFAYLRVGQSHAPAGWTDFYEYHPDLVVTFYGDIALAESGDGGAVFYWSQSRERYGLFARRFNGEGEVTAISPPIRVRAPLELSALRYVAGQGVRATVSVPEDESATLDLFDVTGRRVASSRLTAADAGRNVTIAGTGTLRSGLYFARLATPGAAASGKVIVAR